MLKVDYLNSLIERRKEGNANVHEYFCDTTKCVKCPYFLVPHCNEVIYDDLIDIILDFHGELVGKSSDVEVEKRMDDLISRQALMKEFSDFVRESNNSDFAKTPTWNDAVSLVESLSSAQPEQSIAEWQKGFREYINMLNIPRDDYKGIMEYINDVPSAPERKKGKWIVKENRGFVSHSIYLVCPFCGNTLDPDGLNAGRGDANFCPNCGADMRKGKE